MASFQKTDKGWRVFISKKGFRKSATFRTKREANEWAAKMEISATERTKDGIPNLPFSALLDRYVDEISVQKKAKDGNDCDSMLLGIWQSEKYCFQTSMNAMSQNGVMKD